MNHLNLNLLGRSVFDTDRLFSLLNERNDGYSPTFPPYNIERTNESNYRVSLAVAGFNSNDINIETKDSNLIVRGKKEATENSEQPESQFLHQGISTAEFERRFQLAEHVEVKGANLKDGLLHIDLIREVPESMKARTIEITNGDSNIRQIENVQ